MDQLSQMAMQWNLNVMKEPRGFIKVIQFVIAIFAFATTTSVDTYSEFSYKCGNATDSHSVKINISYPFSVQDNKVSVPLCASADTHQVSPCCDFNAPAQFYVFVGVMAFLYCIAAIVLYVGFDEKYRQHDNIAIVDFLVSAAFVLLWLISSSAWADNVRKLKMYTDPDEFWFEHVPYCKADATSSLCSIGTTGNFAGLNVSLLFGFLNVIVWGGNLWFLYKETKWFANRQNPDLEKPAYPTPPPQSI